jgi:hypothetical protein
MLCLEHYDSARKSMHKRTTRKILTDRINFLRVVKTRLLDLISHSRIHKSLEVKSTRTQKFFVLQIGWV